MLAVTLAAVACAGPSGGPAQAGSDSTAAGAVPAHDEPEAGEVGVDEGRAGGAEGLRRPAGPFAALEADPADVGMGSERLARLDATVEEAVAAGATPGVALAVGRHGRLVRLRGYGRLDHAAGSAPVSPSTLYDLASLTKVIGTTTALMILVDEGRLTLDDAVVEHLPGWDRGDARKSGVTVRQLLLHRAGFIPFRRWFFELAGKEAYRAAIYDEALVTDPGTSTAYSDIGVMTLGLIVEAVTGASLDAFLEERVFRPLGMHDTGFLPDPAVLARVAPTEMDTVWRHEHVRGRVHDENADAMGGVAGHAGLFSSAADLAVFADLMLRGGEVPPCVPAPVHGAGAGARPDAPDPAGGAAADEQLGATSATGMPCPVARPRPVRIVADSTVALFTRRFDASSSRALGWDTPEGRSSAGDYFSARAFGHTGFTGTSIWIDPTLDLFVVLLTNRVNPTRENQAHVPLRRTVHDLAARAITDRPVPRREP
jgi:CubicO group peptidase (beta-lactamase class C family)